VSEAPILAIRGLTVSVAKDEGARATVVDAVDLEVAPGEIVALVGESGSGKTMIGRSILRLLPPVARIDSGEVRFEGADLVRATQAELRRIRGARIGMVFQEPMVSLNPALRVGYQMAEALRLHGKLSAREIRSRSIAMLERVKIADPERCLACHPHEFSGGMRQRIMLASVFSTRPRLLIADEPTTALDAIIQKEVMETLVELARESGTAVLLVSHDLGLVAQYARRVAVMRRGVVVETGETRGVLLSPKHEYTRALLESLPRRDAAPPEAPAGAPLFEVRGLKVDFPGKARWFWQRAPRVPAVDGVDLDVRSGETLAVVGESGSGKTTIGRTLVRLLRETAGQVLFDGRELGDLDKRALLAFRLQTQMVFQDPYSSLDPRMKLVDIVAEGLRHVPGIDAPERERRARRMLSEVGLDGDYAGRFPHELSGGQRQRVCIARAIVAQPRFVVADEPVSALDVTIQKQVLDLLVELKRRFAFTCLFVSHDLGVVERIADRVVVMHRGRILEQGPRDAIFDRPCHPYTRRLLQANARISKTAAGGYVLGVHEVAERAAPEGHRWYPHEERVAAVPVMLAMGDGHRVACSPVG
jgi:peptide/nickel transport system ATP-binding protein